MATSSRPLMTYQVLIALLLLQVHDLAYGVQPAWFWSQETRTCYNIPDLVLQQPQASSWCRSIGGHLLKLDSGDEVNWITEWLEMTANVSVFWTGASDEQNEGQFVWEDGSVAVLPWSADEPNNYQDDQNCVNLASQKWWLDPPTVLNEYLAFDTGCEKEFHFVCERNPDELLSRFWKKVPGSAFDPPAVIRTVSGFTQVSCSDLCARTCQCLSFAYRQDNGGCILYNKHASRLATANTADGYENFVVLV